MKPKQLLAMVCKWYGLKVKEIKGQGLATSVPLSSWRHPIVEESRKIACFLIQKHCCTLSEDEVAATLKRQLQWSSVFIRMSAADVRRKLAEDPALCISVENLERMIMATMMKSMS